MTTTSTFNPDSRREITQSLGSLFTTAVIRESDEGGESNLLKQVRLARKLQNEEFSEQGVKGTNIGPLGKFWSREDLKSYMRSNKLTPRSLKILWTAIANMSARVTTFLDTLLKVDRESIDSPTRFLSRDDNEYKLKTEEGFVFRTDMPQIGKKPRWYNFENTVGDSTIYLTQYGKSVKTDAEPHDQGGWNRDSVIHKTQLQDGFGQSSDFTIEAGECGDAIGAKLIHNQRDEEYGTPVGVLETRYNEDTNDLLQILGIKHSDFRKPEIN